MENILVLPSKKIVYIAIACIIAVGGISFAYLYHPKDTTGADSQILSGGSASTLSAEYSNDTDSDGLKDWEETLWGADAHNPDTDNDGTKDGDEIKASRNPAVKGPKDSLQGNVAAQLSGKASASATTDDEENLTATEKLSQDLFKEYLVLKQSGQEITPDVQNNLIQNFLLRSDLSAPNKIIYLQTDFRINKDTSVEAARAYGNNVGTLIKNDKPKTQVGELAIVEEVFTSGDDTQLVKLDPIISAYKKILLDLRGVLVPADVAEIHAELATELAAYITSVTNMKKIFSDPVLAATSLKTYGQTAVQIDATFVKLNAYFSKKGIVFKESDPGYLFVNGNK